MLVLFDHCTPRGIARYLTRHTIEVASQLGWAELSNGDWIQPAETAGFQVLSRSRWSLVEPVVS
jgi:hypothetical protein